MLSQDDLDVLEESSVGKRVFDAVGGCQYPLGRNDCAATNGPVKEIEFLDIPYQSRLDGIRKDGNY